MRRALTAIGLELLALWLACMQLLGGVRTDEAKYLLSIPYPHPPLVRWLMAQTLAWPAQELFWRILLASLFLQAVWLVWDMGKHLPAHARATLAASWILSAGILVQTGGLLLAPLNALEGLVLVWVLVTIGFGNAGIDGKSAGRYARSAGRNVTTINELQGSGHSARGWLEQFPILIALFWLASLFTAYQAILFLPIVCAIFLRLKLSWPERILYVCGPVILLGLYTFTNPLILASIVHHSGEGNHASLVTRFLETGRLWMIGGSLIASISGTVGIVWSRRWELLCAFLLVFAFVFLDRFDYYAVLLTPLFVAGTLELLERLHVKACTKTEKEIAAAFLILLAACTAILLWHNPLPTHTSEARPVLQTIIARHQSGDILINGDFGHEWEYESPFEIRRYNPALIKNAQAVVCLQTCKDLPSGWQRLPDTEEEVWVK